MDPKKLYKRYIPQRQTLKNHQLLKHLGDWLHDPRLWHFNRRSAANAIAAGLFISFIPIPGQTILAALVAIFARINLPLTIAAVFLSNPITMGPMFIMAHKVGSSMLGLPTDITYFDFSFEWISSTLHQIWKPLLLGCLILGVFVAAVGHVSVRILWRLHLVRRWKTRRSKHKDT